MSDLISRQAILKHIEKIRQDMLMMDDTHRASIVMTGMHLCEEAVRNRPSAEPERKMGRWILYENQRHESECGKSDLQANTQKVSFCWNCGARMDGEE